MLGELDSARWDPAAGLDEDSREFRVVFGYIRASRDHQKLTLESQRAMIQRWWDYQKDISKFGKSDRLVFVEEPGVSASKHDFDKRPQGDYILRMARSGDTIVVSNYDRMFRSLKDCVLMTEKLIEMNINLFIMDTQFDTSTPIGKAAFRLVAVFKQLECEERSRRIKEAFAAKSARISSGVPMFKGGAAEFGWKLVGRGSSAYMVPYAEAREVTQWIHSSISKKVANGEPWPSRDTIGWEIARIGNKHPDPDYKKACLVVSRKVAGWLSAYLNGWPTGKKILYKWTEIFQMEPSPAESLGLPVDEET